MTALRPLQQILQVLGFLMVLGGTGVVVWGSYLPWLNFRVLDIPIELPGFLGVGAMTSSLALLALFISRSYSLMTALLGIFCVLIGFWAATEPARTLKSYILQTKFKLASINSRLEQVSLAPVEPFGAGVLSVRDLTGPGPEWTIWGGAALTVGGLLQFAGRRAARTCRSCGTVWPRGREITFCPKCGTADKTQPRCTVCRQILQRGDRFCTHCSTPQN